MIEITVNKTDKKYTCLMSQTLIVEVHFEKRSKCADIEIIIPREITFIKENIYVNVIGKGKVPFWGEMKTDENATRHLFLKNLDIRPNNGVDVQIYIERAVVQFEGNFDIAVMANVEIEEEIIACCDTVTISSVSTVTDFLRQIPITNVYDRNTDYCAAEFCWPCIPDAEEICLLHSLDGGVNWEAEELLDSKETRVQVTGLLPYAEHWFCIEVVGGCCAGRSNVAKLYSGMYDVKCVGGAFTDGTNNAEKINDAILYLHHLGGGTLLFRGGIFSTTTIHLRSNVYLYIDKGAEIHALSGCDDEETAWYSDEEYRNDQTHMSQAPYLTPDNWMTKQDAGHSYFRNALFVGERLNNIKIVGNGRIAGNNNLTKSNEVMKMKSGCRADKMISLKLCTNVEIGGLSVGKDLWYKETDKPNEDEPFYLEENGNADECGTDNMLHISNGGHFVVLATGVDGISAHDVYAEKGTQVRDVFDFMACNDVAAFNIYVEGSADDVVKLGSDCALGFTRPGKNYIVRNIIGDTACNLFQIGSETADDIQDVCIDNLYVLASDKAGFSISVNDGGHIRNVHLNCGGSVGKCCCNVSHSKLTIGYTTKQTNPYRSVMRRIRTPIFIALSNRGRTLGAEAIQKKFIDDIGVYREELMVTNVNIGTIENVILRNLDVKDVYAASQAKNPAKSRWPMYEGQARTTAMVVGYKIPDSAGVTAPDGTMGKSIKNVLLEDIEIVVKGGNPIADAANTPRELGVGQFNLRNLSEDTRGSKIPAYGLYLRHVDGCTIRNCKLYFEENDDRYAVVADDVKDFLVEKLDTSKSENNDKIIKVK